ncbi:OLC1v1005623C1 [Oldenlandia corymbosa var. corymbosa]|uniref:OLC1v1005623C1 n=1 Tax=Oldenlandia corymbosa var. corymbosa TaxID=529605 RepID=A0AAV1DF05_OLDCO|nr:OLC1v1005623C1 [Oldenlandia corymbosa var. corymbosa]
MVRDSEGKTVLDFVSTIDSVDKVENLRSKYDFPPALEARAPLGNERANSPPRGRITMTPLTRFTPNLITFVLGFARVCQYVKVIPQLILWRYFFQVVVASTSFQEWYIVKQRLRTGVKKMVDAYDDSPEWKPDFVFVKAPASYCLPWNLRETECLRAIHDEWTQVDEECIEEFQADVEKILKYSKVVKWNDVQYCVPPVYGKERDTVNIEGATRIPLELSVEEDQDEDVPVTAAPQKKKKKRIVKVGDRAKSKRSKTDAPSKKTTQPDIETVPLATESVQKPVPEVGPSIVPPAAEKGKGPLEGKAIILPPQLFEGGSSMAVHTFSNPQSIECPVLEEFAAQLNEADSLRLAERDEALFEVVTLEEKARQVQVKEAEIVEVQAKYDELEEKMRSFASLHISKEELHQWCTAFMSKMMCTGGMAVALEEMNLVATKCGAHRVGVAGLKRLDQDRPIKAKWFKQLLMKDPKKTMHEAMVKVLTRLSLEQLPLWGALTGAMAKMSSPSEIASFPGDVPAVLARGPSEEDPIPEVPDEYMGIELEDADKETEEDVTDTGIPEFREPLRMPPRPLPRILPMTPPRQ